MISFFLNCVISFFELRFIVMFKFLSCKSFVRKHITNTYKFLIIPEKYTKVPSSINFGTFCKNCWDFNYFSKNSIIDIWQGLKCHIVSHTRPYSKSAIKIETLSTICSKKAIQTQPIFPLYHFGFIEQMLMWGNAHSMSTNKKIDQHPWSIAFHVKYEQNFALSGWLWDVVWYKTH